MAPKVRGAAPSQVRVADGSAILTAVRKPTPGVGGEVFPWLSGMVSTGGSGTATSVGTAVLEAVADDGPGTEGMG